MYFKYNDNYQLIGFFILFRWLHCFMHHFRFVVKCLFKRIWNEKLLYSKPQNGTNFRWFKLPTWNRVRTIIMLCRNSSINTLKLILAELKMTFNSQNTVKVPFLSTWVSTKISLLLHRKCTKILINVVQAIIPILKLSWIATLPTPQSMHNYWNKCQTNIFPHTHRPFIVALLSRFFS